MSGGWQFWIDRGGTFTDIVARDSEGRLLVHKLLSENPGVYDDAPIEGIRQILGLGAGEPIPAERIDSVRMGTTIATNALLERKGAPLGFVVTKGFGDLLEIGNQDRPDIFALEIVKPELLYQAVAEVDERILADGQVLQPLDEGALREALKAFQETGIESVAILFLHAFAYPEHERRAAAIAREMKFEFVAASHEVAPEIKAVSRGDTTTLDAYLTPLLRSYVDRVRGALGSETRLRFMQSNGGLANADRFSGKNAVLSGPSGGVVACAHISRAAGIGSVLGFDMGGTSTDVCRFDGAFERVFETKVAGVRLNAPMLHIETVAAGGGSILRFEAGRLTAGPESAGASPGPACYGKGGPAAVTDANLLLGRIQARYFPACFGPGADQPLDKTAAEERISELAALAGMSIEATAAGFIRVANERMLRAIRSVSVAKGYDVRDYALACFGGAGAQHACAIAEELGIQTIVHHPLAGVLSAYGIGLADTIDTRAEPVLRPFDAATFAALESRYRALEEEGRAALQKSGIGDDNIRLTRSADLRYAGVETFLNVEGESYEALARGFVARHLAQHGFLKPGHPIEIQNIRVESVGVSPSFAEETIAVRPGREPLSPLNHVSVHFDRPYDTPVYDRGQLYEGDRIDGPALIIEATSTVVVEPRWQVEVTRHGYLILRLQEATKLEPLADACDPVMLEVFNNLFMSIAEQMGIALEATSHSANIKERLDFSCALFGADGGLVANAPHMPVHLGAMGESVKAIIEARSGTMRPGDVYATNDPYHGGSHLPDITVVSPVFGQNGSPAFYVANRAHHADVGGIAPGSMPPFSKRIEEEGVLLHDVSLVSGGRFLEDDIVHRLTDAPHPARNVPERLSDLRAQIAANARGIAALRDLNKRYGEATVQAYMRHVRANAANAMEAKLRTLSDGVYRAKEYLDDGTVIACEIVIDGARARVDFAGTGPQSEGNLNAPPAVAIAAVLYVFRTLIDRAIPLNAGCLDPIAILIPEDNLLRPVYPAAVVGGNVETSSRIVDVLYKALGAVAGAQGTMNNLSFGVEDWGYYETICGGAGAGPGFHGASAVHTHMTNTRITDPEVLERRYPVILLEFSIRRGSGGKGQFNGGDGVRRVIEFREPMSVSILSERRETQPYGLNGAAPGAPGRNWILSDGKTRPIGGHATVMAGAGDAIVIETPGGGGWNPQDEEDFSQKPCGD